jgi:hypothetical protein
VIETARLRVKHPKTYSYSLGQAFRHLHFAHPAQLLLVRPSWAESPDQIGLTEFFDVCDSAQTTDFMKRDSFRAVKRP